MLTVRLFGDPVLRRRARPVPAVDESLRALARDMIETMHASRGIGLAATQVGDLRRIIVVDASAGEREGEAFALVNPRIVATAGSFTDEEGCLSLPGLRLPVRRALDARVEGLDLAGNPVVREASGLLARILQHEIDHLDGVLFVDRLPLFQRLALWFRLRRLRRAWRAAART